MRRIAGIASVAIFFLVGCAQPGSSPPAGPGQGFDERAKQVANGWDATGMDRKWREGFVPLQELTVLPPDAGLTDATKIAYASGWYRLNAQLPPAVLEGSIRYTDRSPAANVPLVTAADAFAALKRADPPPNCNNPAPQPSAQPPSQPTPQSSGKDGATGTSAPHTCATLTVTAVSLGTTPLRTSRGLATVPAWLFTVEGLRAPIARVAVAPSAVTPLPTPSLPPASAGGPVSVSDIVAAEDMQLTVNLVVGACDTKFSGLAYETDRAVVVGGRIDQRTGEVCTDQALYKPVTVKLSKPLGSRVVLDANSGRPLPTP